MEGSHSKVRFSVSHLLKSPIETSLVHDFFEKQPIQNAEVYILRAIIHDWSDAYAGKILKRLREASGPKTRLLCIDKIIPYACRAPEESFGSSIPGLVKDSAPEPLFANFCSSNPAPFNGDMNVCLKFPLFHHG